jgi:hypothetical protein
MNLLSLIGFFLLLFSFLSISFWSDREMSEEVRMSHSGYCAAYREANNQIEEKLYNTTKSQEPKKSGKLDEVKREHKDKEKKPNPTPVPPVVEEEEEDNVSTLCNCGSFDISFLFEESEVDKVRYEQLATLLRSLYGNYFAELNEKKLEYRLIDSLSLSGKKELKEKKSLNLITLQLQDSSLQPIFYRLLQGTKYYNSKNKEGVPPLMDFIRITSPHETKICLIKAPYEVLVIMIGEKGADDIVHARKKKNYISNEAFQQLAIQDHFEGKKDLYFLSHCHHKKFTSEKVQGNDECSQIKVNKAY